MAGDWRGWRLLVVGEQRFRWQANYAQEGISVRLEDDPQVHLSVRLRGFRLSPGEVRQCIDEARRRGWLTRLRNFHTTVPELPATCVFENSFHTPALRSAWLTSAVLGLAAAVAERNDFSILPILADALEEAGCDDATILTHCRATAPHPRQCSLVAAILAPAATSVFLVEPS